MSYQFTLMSETGPRRSEYADLDFAHEMFNLCTLLPGERKILQDSRGNLCGYQASNPEVQS